MPSAPNITTLHNGHNMKTLALCLIFLFISACSVTSDPVTGPAGNAGQHTPVFRDTQGNVLGYYEYLPKNFNANNKQAYPILFYWNGKNTIRGNGRDDLDGLLQQGLSQYINEGRNYPAIIISGMVSDPDDINPHEFVEYILKRYEDQIDPNRFYMTGFSAGGGITVRYISEHPEKFAAYLPVQASVDVPGSGEPSIDMSKVASWFIHNSGDLKADVWYVNLWNRALRDLGGDHKISRIDSESHYAWKEAYASDQTWQWLFSKNKSNIIIGKTQ